MCGFLYGLINWRIGISVIFDQNDICFLVEWYSCRCRQILNLFSSILKDDLNKARNVLIKDGSEFTKCTPLLVFLLPSHQNNKAQIILRWFLANGALLINFSARFSNIWSNILRLNSLVFWALALPKLPRFASLSIAGGGNSTSLNHNEVVLFAIPNLLPISSREYPFFRNFTALKYFLWNLFIEPL